MSDKESWQSCFRPDLFRGKTALVTGGGTGIGLAIAQELASLGATVIIASRDVKKCEQGLTSLPKTSGRVIVGPSTNIRDESEVQALVAFCIEQTGSLDLVVNNAGGQFIANAEDLSANGFAAVVNTNLLGTFLVCREAYRQYMRDHNTGSIVNITLGNRNGMPGMSHSGASRAGVENLTASLCTEWMNAGVRINCVRPGIIYTDSGFASYGPAADYFLDKLLHSIPARRLGSAEEIASAVVWLLSPGASYVTGSVINVDGGSGYTLLPLVEVDDESHLPVYGKVPTKARL